MRRGQRGFTLIEVLAVFSIVALAAMLVLPALSEITWNMQLQGAMARLGQYLERARAEAIRLNRASAVIFSPSEQSIGAGSGPGNPLFLNRDVLYLEEDAPDVEITFHGDATSSGGRVSFRDRKGNTYVLTVQPSNGRCRMERGNGP